MLMRILTALVLLASCLHTNAQICTKSQLPANLQNGLVAFYPFCGNANDASGNGNNGTSNNITYGVDRFGGSNSSGVFTKANSSYFFYPAATQFQPNSFTISAWFNTNVIQSGPLGSGMDQFIAGYSPNTWVSGPSYQLALDRDNNSRVFSRMWTTTTSWQDIYTNPGTISTGNWYYGVITYDGSTKTQTFYLNGNLVNTLNTQLQFFNQSGFYIGASRQNLAGTITTLFDGKIDDVMFYNRALSSCEIEQLYNATSNNVPQQQGISTNGLSDTTRVCGSSTILDAGAGFSAYQWSTGATTQTITPTSSGFYKVTVTNASGCTGSDSTYLSLVKANIIQNDTTICKGSSITISIDSTSMGQSVCSSTQLPAGLQNGLLAYYPFCGNANNALGSGNNGVVFNATLTTDRFGNANSAYSFNGTNAYIDFGANNQIGPTTTIPISISVWVSGGASGNVISKYTNLDAPKSYFLFGRSANGYSWIGNGTNPYINNSGVSDNTWTHYVLIGVAGTNNSKVYRNGTLIATGTLAMNTTMQAVSLLVGKVGASFPGFLNGKVDDILIYNRILSDSEIKSLSSNAPAASWSNGGSNNSITVSPAATSKYYVTLTDGITTCQDSVTITVVDPQAINSLSDTTRICGTSTTLKAGDGFDTYLWNTGETTQSISPTKSGFYKVTGTKGGCNASDSTYLSLVKATILNRDTTICKGTSLVLSIDSTVSGTTNSGISQLPQNLRNGLVAYYPFTGNANDVSGNGNNGIVYGATLSSDRFGNTNAAYSFNGTNQYIQSASISKAITNKTYSAWVKLSTLNQSAGGLLGLQSSNGQIFDVVVYNETNNGWGFGSDFLTRSVWSGVKETSSQWVMITATYEQNSYKLYRNGILIGSTTQFGITNFATTSKINIGYRHTGGATPFLNAIIDDAYIYDRVLTQQEIASLYNVTSVNWSTGATGNSITISPIATSKYYVTVSDGITSCQDSVTVTVFDPAAINTLSDTTRVCGTSTTLKAGDGFDSYSWNSGETTQSISPTKSGFYKVTGTKGGCIASDSTYLSIVNAKIIQRDTTICKGASITLSVDSLLNTSNSCVLNELPANLRNGLVGYWPFCGNANDLSGNGNHAQVNGPVLTTDRFNNSNSAYLFNNNYLRVPNSAALNSYNFSISLWVKTSSLNRQFPIARLNYADASAENYVIGLNDLAPYGIELAAKYNNPSCTRNLGWQRNEKVQNILDDKYHHVVGTVNGPLMSLYVDGVLIQSVTIPYSQTSPCWSGDLQIGRNWANDPGYFLGSMDDIMIYNRSLQPSEVSQLFSTSSSINWSTGSTANTINVSPSQTTKYYVTISDGITTCKDSITVTVSDIGTFNPLQDTIRVCGDSVILDAGSGYSSYNWNSGATTQKITVKSGGKYAVSVSNALGCSTSDSTLVSIVKAKILQKDTTVCKGTTIRLSIDSTFPKTSFTNVNNLNSISGLRAYFPFNGNANDESGNGNNGIVYNAKLSQDQNGNIDKAYSFSPSFQSSIIPSKLDVTMKNSFAYSFWVKPSGTCTIPAQGQSSNAASGLFNNPCVVHPIHGFNYGPAQSNAGTGIYVGVNGLYLEEHSDGWEAVPISYTGDLSGWHLINIMYSNKVPSLYIDGKFIKSGLASPRNVYASLGPDLWPGYTRSGIGAGYRPPGSATDQYFSGEIDELRYYNKALTTQEIQTIFTGNIKILWSTGDTTASINITPTQTTKYYVTVSDGITSCKDSITVTVASLDTSITALDPTSVCSTGGNVRLQAGVANTYQWLKDGAVISGATARLYSATQTGSYRVVVSNTAGCTDTSRAIAIVLDPKPIPNFTINNNAQCLTENGFNFTNTSTISSGTMTYTWNLGEGTIVSTTDASKTYTAAGTYNIKLIATSNRQCVDSITKSITVYAQPVIPTITGADEFCKGSSITLSTNAPTTRQWYWNDAILSGAAGASLTIQQSGNYKVTTQNANGCISESLVKVITENPLPQGSLNIPSSLFICEGTPYTLTASGGTTYQWYLNNIAIAGETSSTLTTGIPGNYKVEFVSDKGCRSMSTNTIDLTLIKAPDAAFSYDTYCVNVQTNFSSRSTTNLSGIVTYAWKFGDGKTAGNTTNTSNIYSRSGNFTATLLVTPTACPQLVDSAQAVIAIQDPTPGIQYPPVNVIINRSQQLNARNIGISYLWSPGLYLNNITSRTPVITTSKEQLYRILITNAAGCNTIDTQLVRVFPDRNIYVPEGFTPDNDGRNDKLYPITVGISEMKVFRIYNRWGLLVYDNKNANANTGWDGTYKGTKQPMETFAWVAEGIDIDGNYLRRTGNTILIR